MFVKEAGTHKLNDVWLHCKSLPANFYSGKLLHVGDDSKTTNVRPIFKKYVRSEIKTTGLLTCEIYSQKFTKKLRENLTNYVDTFLSNFISAYRKSGISNHVLLRLIERWKNS